MLKLAKKLIDGVLAMKLEETRAAIRFVAERNRVILEGAAGCAVAAAVSGRVPGAKIVAIVSGGNIDFGILAEILTAGDGRR